MIEAKEENKYFFSNFSSIRESKGITIDDIASKTKLQKNYIIAIESGDFKILPPVYAKLFLKTYSNFLNFDTENILRLFNEHITGKHKKRQVITSNTPQFIENKESIKDKINPNFKNELYDNNYFVEPKKILALFMFIVIVLTSWSAIAYINDYKKNSQEKYKNLLLNWEFYKDTNRFILSDSQTVLITDIKDENTYKYEAQNNIINKLIIGTEKNKSKSGTLEDKDYDTKKFKGLTEFGIGNGHIKFYINNQPIEFKHKDKAIWGILNPEKNNTLTLKYYSYKN